MSGRVVIVIVVRAMCSEIPPRDARVSHQSLIVAVLDIFIHRHGRRNEKKTIIIRSIKALENFNCNWALFNQHKAAGARKLIVIIVFFGFLKVQKSREKMKTINNK